MNNQYELYFHTDCVQKQTLNNISHSTCAFGGRGVHDAPMLYQAFQNYFRTFHEVMVCNQQRKGIKSWPESNKESNFVVDLSD